VCYSVSACLSPIPACVAHTCTHKYTLPHTATHCNSICCSVLQYECVAHTCTHKHTLQHTATHCTILQHTATHYNSICCSVMQYECVAHTCTHKYTLQHKQVIQQVYLRAPHVISISQHVPLWHRCSKITLNAVCCSALQCSVVCCSVLQRVITLNALRYV